MPDFRKTIKVIYATKDKTKDIRYFLFILLGDNVPEDIKKILDKIRILSYPDSINKCSDSEIKKLEKYYGLKWPSLFWPDEHLSVYNGKQFLNNSSKKRKRSTSINLSKNDEKNNESEEVKDVNLINQFKKLINPSKEKEVNESELSNIRQQRKILNDDKLANNTDKIEKNNIDLDKDIPEYSLKKLIIKNYRYDITVFDDEIIIDLMKKISLCLKTRIDKNELVQIPPEYMYLWSKAENGEYISLTHNWEDVLKKRTWALSPKKAESLKYKSVPFNNWISTKIDYVNEIRESIDDENYNIIYNDLRYKILWDLPVEIGQIFVTDLISDINNETTLAWNKSDYINFYNSYVKYYYPDVSFYNFKQFASKKKLFINNTIYQNNILINSKLRSENYISNIKTSKSLGGRAKIIQLHVLYEHGIEWTNDEMIILFNNAPISSKIPIVQRRPSYEQNNIKIYKPALLENYKKIILQFQQKKTSFKGIIYRVNIDKISNNLLYVNLKNNVMEIRINLKEKEKKQINEVLKIIYNETEHLISSINKTSIRRNIPKPITSKYKIIFINSIMNASFKENEIDISKMLFLTKIWYPWLRSVPSSQEGLTMKYIRIPDFQTPSFRRERIQNLISSGKSDEEIVEIISKEYFISSSIATDYLNEVKDSFEASETILEIQDYKMKGVNIQIGGNPLKINVKGARNEQMLTRVFSLVLKLFQEYKNIYIDKKKKIESLDWVDANLMKIKKLKNIDKVISNIQISSNKNISAIKARFIADPTRLKKGEYPRLCQAKFQPDPLTEEQAIKLGFKKNKEGNYEGLIEGKKRVALGLPRLDNKDIINYWVCKPSVTGEYKHIGFHGTRKTNDCLPCCTLKLQKESSAENRRNIYNRCTNNSTNDLLKDPENIVIKPQKNAFKRVLMVSSMRKNPGRLCVINGLLCKLSNKENNEVTYGGQTNTEIIETKGTYYMLGTPVTEYSLQSFLFSISYALEITVKQIKQKVGILDNIDDYIYKIITEYNTTITILKEKSNGDFIIEPISPWLHSAWHYMSKHIIVVKLKDDKYEHYNPICLVKKEKNVKNLEIDRIFDSNNLFFKDILEWAITNELSPREIPYCISPMTSKKFLFGLTIYTILKYQFKIEISGQIVTNNSECVFIILNSNSLFPVFPSPKIKNIECYNLSEINKFTKTARNTLDSYNKELPEVVNKLLGNWTIELGENNLPASLKSDTKLTVPILPKNENINLPTEVEIYNINNIERLISEQPEHNKILLKREWYENETEQLFYFHLSESLYKDKLRRSQIVEIINSDEEKYIKFQKIYNILIKFDKFFKSVKKINPDTIKNYKINNQRELCNIHKTPKVCDKNAHCIWDKNICLLSVLEKKGAVYISKASVGLLEDYLFRNELLKYKNYSIQRIVNYDYININKDEILLTNMNQEYIEKKIIELKKISENNNLKYDKIYEKKLIRCSNNAPSLTVYNIKNYSLIYIRESAGDPLFRALAYSIYSMDYAHIPYSERTTNAPIETIERWVRDLKFKLLYKLDTTIVKKDLLNAYILGTRINWIDEEIQLKILVNFLPRPIEVWKITSKNTKMKKIKEYRSSKHKNKKIEPYKLGVRIISKWNVCYSITEKE